MGTKSSRLRSIAEELPEGTPTRTRCSLSVPTTFLRRYGLVGPGEPLSGGRPSCGVARAARPRLRYDRLVLARRPAGHPGFDHAVRRWRHSLSHVSGHRTAVEAGTGIGSCRLARCWGRGRQGALSLLPASQALDRTPAVLRRAGKNALFAADEFFAARTSPILTPAAPTPVPWAASSPGARNKESSCVRSRRGWPGASLRRFPDRTPPRIWRWRRCGISSTPWSSRHAVALNPFSSVRGRKHAVVDGKTPQLAIQQARDLLASIDLSHVVGLRDRALLGTLAYTGARVGALARLRRQDLEDQGAQRVLRFREKGGQQREIPVRHDLDRWLEEYLMAARIAADPKETPLFRAALGKQKKLSRNPLSANSMRRMLKRRLKDARLPDIFSPHSFRVLVVTDLLAQDVPLEDVQYLAGHANPKTTQIYDRRQKRVTRNIVERISV